MTEGLSLDTARPDVPGLVPLDPDYLIHGCDCNSLNFTDTAELQPRVTPLGQDRVLEAKE